MVMLTYRPVTLALYYSAVVNPGAVYPEHSGTFNSRWSLYSINILSINLR